MATNASSGISLSGVWPSSGGGPSSLSGSTQTPSEPPQRPSGQERTGLLPRQGHIGGAVGHANIRGPQPRFSTRGPIPRGLGRPTPFFIREIYKNGFLKRLPYNEKKSSALSKLLRSDRYWVVFSVHDDILPFLELWNEPTEVATRPPHLMFPLAICQHISPSIVPSDNEWSFVVNFEAAAIRFSCNSRQVMEEWVECIRMKLGEMGILNPKGNLYSKVPPPPQKTSNNNPMPVQTGRNPMSPLPQPPVEAQSPAGNTVSSNSVPASSEEVQAQVHQNTQEISNRPRTRASIVDASDESNQTFTTSIYLNQTPPHTPQQRVTKSDPTKSSDVTSSSRTANYLTDTQTVSCTLSNESDETTPNTSLTLFSSKSAKETSSKTKKSHHVIPAMSYEQVVIVPPVSSTSGEATSSSIKSKVTLSNSVPTSTLSTTAKVSAPISATSVYLNKTDDDLSASSARHVTVIPINSIEKENGVEPSDVEVNKDVKSLPGSSSGSNNVEQCISVSGKNENLPQIQHPRQGSIQRDKIEEESYYDAIFEFDENSTKPKNNEISTIPTSTSSSTNNVQPSQSILKTNSHHTNASQTPSLSTSTSIAQHPAHQSPKKRQQSPTRPSTVNMGRQSEPLPPPPPPSLPYENYVLDGDSKERRERERERRRRGSREELGSRASPNKVSATSVVSRRCSDKRTLAAAPSTNNTQNNSSLTQHQKIRKQRSQRSSSLGPLVDDHVIVTSKKSLGSTANWKECRENHDPAGISNMLKVQSRATNTNSLESVDSNPRHAVAKCDQKRYEKDSHAAIRAIRASAGPRRPPLNISNPIQALNSSVSSPPQDTILSTSPSTSSTSTHPLIGSPPRHVTDLPPGLRHMGYHPMASLQVSGSPIAPPPTAGIGPHPPHIPLPGLTCQLSFIPSMNNTERTEQQRSDVSQQQNVQSSSARPVLREQQVLRLRQEIMHPSGVRLTLRKKDCQNSLALVEFFGCVWVVGWKQREFPVLYNAFHVGDQILSVSGTPIKTVHEFNKLVKHHLYRTSGNSESKPNPPQTPNNSITNPSGSSHSQINSLSASNVSEPLPHVEIIVRRLPFAQGKYRIITYNIDRKDTNKIRYLSILIPNFVIYSFLSKT